MQGKIVYKSTAYGIVCSMKRAYDGILLQLDLDITKKECNFSKLSNRLPFSTLMNTILEQLARDD